MVTHNIYQFLEAATSWDTLKEKMSEKRANDQDLNDYYRKWYSFVTAYNNAQKLDADKRSDRYGVIHMKLVKSLHDVALLPARLKDELLPVLELVVKRWNDAFPEHSIE